MVPWYRFAATWGLRQVMATTLHPDAGNRRDPDAAAYTYRITRAFSRYSAASAGRPVFSYSTARFCAAR